MLEYYGTDLADLNTHYSNIKQTNKVPITLLSTDGTSTSCVYPFCEDTEQTLDNDAGGGYGAGSVEPGDVCGIDRCHHLQRHGHRKSTECAIKLLVDVERPRYRQPVLHGVRRPRAELVSSGGRHNGAWTSSSGIYPADDAYLTSVGGTDLTTKSAAGPRASETACVDGGGDISPDNFAIPSWQTATASGCSNCSHVYRNGPDVSANANFTVYVCADQSGCTANSYGGTSFAAPMWAGYLALVNQQAVADGNPKLGFINPILYSIGLGSSYATDFHDITSGSNRYPARTGYDLAIGWGSPNGFNLLNALAGSSTPGFSLSASPSSISVVQGDSAASTITSTVTGGFSGVISLTATGQPAGVTVSFSPASISGA